MVEKYQPPEESGIDFDLDSAQVASDAVAEAEAVVPRGAKFLAEDGPFMRFVWWTLRTVFSLVIPLGIFFAMQKCRPLVDSAYHMLNPGTNPYPLLMKGGLGVFLASLIAAVPALMGLYLGALLAKFKNLKPVIAVSIWCVLIFIVCIIFVVIAKYFNVI